MTEHLAFDQLQAINLSFSLSIATGRRESGIYRAAVSLQSGGECLDDRYPGGTGFSNNWLRVSEGGRIWL